MPACWRAAGTGRRAAQAVKIDSRRAHRRQLGGAAVFDGCSTQGQASPGQPQPIQIVRAAARQAPPSREHPCMNALHNFLFTVYPYICLAVFLMGSLARFDRDQYTWKSDSSQLLRAGSCAGAATCSTAASCSCSSATCSAC
jgi:hypothetical protein